MEWPKSSMRLHLLFRHARPSASTVCVHSNEGIQLRVELLNPAQMGIHKFDGRHFSSPDSFGHFAR
jgi:hypothetical protein